jgi:purine-binding chemotaxis protein CheW
VTGGVGLSAEETARVLAERARLLARPTAAASRADVLELIVFELAGERYAVETRYAVEVVGRAEVALMPGAEPPLVGITAWRGELLPVLDVRWILRLPTASPDQPALLLVLGQERATLAVLVDAVLDLRELPASAFGPLPGHAGRGRGLLRGSTEDAVLLLAAADLIDNHSTGAPS